MVLSPDHTTHTSVTAHTSHPLEAQPNTHVWPAPTVTKVEYYRDITLPFEGLLDPKQVL